MASSRRTSWVFEFGFFQLHIYPAAVSAVDDDEKAKCISCGTVMTATSSSGTSHMQRHLTRACKSLPTRAVAQFVKKVADDARARQSPLSNINSRLIAADNFFHEMSGLLRYYGVPRQVAAAVAEQLAQQQQHLLGGDWQDLLLSLQLLRPAAGENNNVVVVVPQAPTPPPSDQPNAPAADLNEDTAPAKTLDSDWDAAGNYYHESSSSLLPDGVPHQVFAADEELAQAQLERQDLWLTLQENPPLISLL